MKKLLVIACLFAFAAPVAFSIAAPSDVVVVSDLQEEKKEIKAKDLPEAVQKTIEEDYAEMEIDKVYSVTKADKTNYFSVVFTGEDGESMKVKFDSEGGVIA